MAAVLSADDEQPTAVETIKSLGVVEALEPKTMRGDAIAQGFEFTESQNAKIIFGALPASMAQRVARKAAQADPSGRRIPQDRRRE